MSETQNFLILSNGTFKYTTKELSRPKISKDFQQEWRLKNRDKKN